MTTKTFTLYDEGTGVKVLITATAAVGPNTGVDFHINLEEGTADLTGFFLDIGEPGGKVFQTEDPQTNMNGTAGFDYAFQLGTGGGNDADYTGGKINIPGISLDDLEGATVGIRAQSVGEDRESSLKLTGTEDLPPPPDVTFEVEKAISNIVIYADYDGDDILGNSITKIKFDNFDLLDCDKDGVTAKQGDNGDELHELTLSQLYEALGAVGKSDGIILGVTIKAGADQDAGFSKGEGQFFDADPETSISTGTTTKANHIFEAADYADVWC
jgi:hypothetical protein